MAGADGVAPMNFDNEGRQLRYNCYKCGAMLDGPTLGPVGTPGICQVCCRKPVRRLAVKGDVIAWLLMALGVMSACTLAWQHPEMTDRELWLKHPLVLVGSMVSLAVGAWIWATGDRK